MAYWVEDIWPVWECECPNCLSNVQLSDGDFITDTVDGAVAEISYTICDRCFADLKVIKPE